MLLFKTLERAISGKTAQSSLLRNRDATSVLIWVANELRTSLFIIIIIIIIIKQKPSRVGET